MLEIASMRKKDREELKGDVKEMKKFMENINMWLRFQVLSVTQVISFKSHVSSQPFGNCNKMVHVHKKEQNVYYAAAPPSPHKWRKSQI